MTWGVMYEMFKSSKGTLEKIFGRLGFGEAGKSEAGREGSGFSWVMGIVKMGQWPREGRLTSTNAGITILWKRETGGSKEGEAVIWRVATVLGTKLWMGPGA